VETGLIIGGAVALIVLTVIILATRYYHRVPPSEVMVIYGRADQARMVTNGGAFVIPVLEEYKRLDLRIITIKTEKDEVYTISGVPIRLDWVAQVQIDATEGGLITASKAFLDKSHDEILQVIEETLSANFRAIVGQMTVEAIHRDRDEFVQRVQDLASDDVAAMGVRIISMGIEEITDEEGYLEAMAAPQIAAVKRDARIAQAEADREARVKAAAAKQQAEQAELDSEREILAQREALRLREVEVERRVGMEQAESDREVQQRRALAVEQEQEAVRLVPARAQREAIEIEAEGERRRIEIEAQARAKATREAADANAEATEKKGRADASALQARKEAEAAGERAKLLAEAEGRREIAAASAAEGEINLRQFVIEQVTKADVDKVRAIADAMAGLGGNVRIVQFGENGKGNGSGTGNTLLDMLMNIPEVSEMFMAKTEALSGEDFEVTLQKAAQLFNTLKNMETTGNNLVDIDNEAGNASPLPIESVTGNGSDTHRSDDSTDSDKTE
jgi:flotillin